MFELLVSLKYLADYIKMRFKVLHEAGRKMNLYYFTLQHRCRVELHVSCYFCTQNVQVFSFHCTLDRGRKMPSNKSRPFQP